MPEIEKAARRGQSGDGYESNELTTEYHEKLRAATAADAGSSEKAPASASQEEPAAATRLRLLHDGKRVATECGFDERVAQLAALVARTLHEGVEAGGISEAERRCALLIREIRLNREALRLARKQLKRGLV